MIKAVKFLTAVLCIIIFVSCVSRQTDKNGLNTTENTEQIQQPVKRRIRIADPSLNAIVTTAWDNYHTGRYEQAALDFERLYKKGYTHYDILFGAGISYFKYYDLKKSIVYLNLAIASKPDHFAALYTRGIYYSYLKKYTEAKKNFSSVLLLELHENFTCGYYKKDYADKNDLQTMKNDITQNLMN